jgi:hypothetical protein
MGKRRDIEKALIAHGGHFQRHGGEHDIWRCGCGQHQTSIPRHGEITNYVIGKITKQMPCLPKGWEK